MTDQAPPDVLVYVGTYTTTLPHVVGKSDGIYLHRLDLSSGELTFADKLAGVANPSFLVIDARKRYLYAVNELFEFEGKASGAVSSFAIDPASGALTPLNQQPSHGTGPCHLSIDQTGKFLFVANYNGGNFAIYPLQEDGRIGEAVQVIQHEGPSGVNPRRQDVAHAHLIFSDPANRFVFVPDLGLDKLMIYAFDENTGRVTPAPQPWVETAPGAGPRHFTLHPKGRHGFLINELDSTLTAFAYRPEDGSLEPLQTLSTLPDGFAGQSTCADVQVSPSGRFVYGSNRGYDSIAIFAFDEQTGTLTPVGYEPSQGVTPRHFAIDPSETFFLVANQDTDTIVSFRIDSQTGGLTPTGHVTHVATPVCLIVTRLDA
jgi:6-phosphogluconolactonase